MHATVVRLAVASLVVTVSLPAQGTAAATATAMQDSAPIAQISARSEAAVDTIQFGARTIPAGQSISGPVLVVGGDLRVQGTIRGAAVVIAGDVLVDSGGRIEGDALAALGRVKIAGGSVGGSARSFEAPWMMAQGTREAAARERASTRGALELAVGWMFVMLLLGIGVLVFAGGYVEGVADVLERSFWRSFVWGLVTEVALLPACILLVAGLAVTVVGILLIPFAVVAYILAAAGLITLGFLAMAKTTGEGFRAGKAGRLGSRGRSLRGMVVGVILYMGLWIIASAFQWSPIVSGVLRAVALAVTFVAATAGFGAAILSRGGTRRDVAQPAPPPSEMASWQTPTPITGVVAARRPTPAIPRERI